MLRRWFTLLLISMLPILTMAQSGTVYPIDLSVMITPPYGPCLKEYVGSNRINIQALLKDFRKTSDQFVVELKVTDNRNRVVLLTHFGDYQFAPGKTFTYPMGQNATEGDKRNVLHDLFDNARIKPKNECFEEGSYIFTFQAFDAHSYNTRKIALSMPFSYPVFLQGNSVAPLQIYPYENEVICPHSYEYTAKNGVKRYATQLGGIAYQWQSANPTGMRVGYLLQVVDLGQIGEKTKDNIESEANSMFDRVDRANYTVNVLSYSPFYNHPFTVGNYVEGNAYAWRVFALTGDELNEGENANVKGKDAPARVFYFCGAPGIEKDDYEVIKDDREFDKNLHKVKLDSIKSTELNALASWRDSSVKDNYCGVNVEIRKKGQEKWTPYFVEKTENFEAGKDPTDNTCNFENLSYNTHYEVRAQYVKCTSSSDRTEDRVYAPYSDIMEFVIAQPIDSATCGGNLPKLAECGEGSKVPKILAGDTIIANGTRVVVDSVSYPNATDSSIISGTAHLSMPIVKNIQMKMEFKEIQINCARELVKGTIKSVWDEKTCAMVDLDELIGEESTGGKDKPSANAKLLKYPQDANTCPSGSLMVDDKGTVWFKTKDGKDVEIGKVVEFNSNEYQSSNFLSGVSHYIEFYNEDKVNNAFDNDAQGYYRKMVNEYDFFDSSESLILPWLANNPGKQKTIKAREVIKKTTVAPFESVQFVIPTDNGYIQLNSTKDDAGNYELQIPGLSDVENSTPIFAIARTSSGTAYFDAGKMMQANYAERTHKLKIVSLVGDLESAYKTEAEKALNSIYGRLGITFEVELEKFDNDSIQNIILKDGLSIAADDESCWKKETKEMRAIRKLYSESNEIEDNTAYLFVVNHAQEDNFKDTEGDMPRGQAVGYIFKDKVNDAPKFGRLVAHEIGHGVYKLQHTFDYDGLAEKKAQTDNIMDYNTSKPNDFLAHYQWRVMQDSVMFVWGLLQDDEDGMGILDRFHWIGRNTSSMFAANKSIFFDTPEEDKVEAHESLFEEISECVGNKKPYIAEEGWTYRTSWKPWNFPEMSNLLKQIIETKQVNLKNVKANNYYYSDIDADYFSGRVFAFVFKDAPELSDYKVADVCQLMLHKRSKAVCYGQKYSMIPFYSKSGDLILALMFVPDDKNKNKYRNDMNRYFINFIGLTTKIAETLLVDPSLMIIKKEHAAILADHVYYRTDDPNDKIWIQIKKAFNESDWEVCSDNDEIRKSVLFFDHSMCGFHSQLYKHKTQNKYCYVTGGTDFDTELRGTHGRTLGKDGKTDYEQAFGEYLYQYVHSVAAAVRLHNAMKKGMELCFVGHSLGGGLATCNSLATGCPAITFNPAAISEGTMEYFDEKYKSDLNRRVLERDVLKREFYEERDYLKDYVKNEVPKLETRVSLLKEEVKGMWKNYRSSNDPYQVTLGIIRKKEKEISETEKEIAEANEDLRKINEEKELVDLMLSSLKDEPLYFISKEGETVLNYVIKNEGLDGINSVTSYLTDPLGSYIYINLEDNPLTKGKYDGITQPFDRHSIDRFLEYWGFIDPNKK